MQKDEAARIILRFWQLSKIRYAFEVNHWNTYLSFVSPQESNYATSTLMYGRHIAELSNSKNPYLDTQLVYHRYNKLNRTLLHNLLLQFGIRPELTQTYTCTPLSRLRNTPIKQTLCDTLNFHEIPFKLVTKKSLSLLFIAKKDLHRISIEDRLCSLGIHATFWEIAQYLKLPLSNLTSQNRESFLDKQLINLEQLQESSQVQRLAEIASQTKYPTHLLADCLDKIILHLHPLEPKALQRIALMLDIANTFYSNNYSQYAFCVYTIIHEISLSLLHPNQEELFEKYYKEFLQEAENSFFQFLGIKKKETLNSLFLAAPALSGTNAYTIAMELARNIKTQSQKPPTWQLIEPVYFEFKYTTDTTSAIHPDCYVIHSGPIVDEHGLHNGININEFIQEQLPQDKPPRPITLIIDATIALYEHFKLDDYAKKRVQEGFLSLIIHESHQKFGLLHTDQAQYGRVLALCSKQSFSDSFIRQVQNNAYKDFLEHVDMRIGAFINIACGNTLEEIKKRHFQNGALWAQSSSFLSPNKSKRPNEALYFSCLSKDSYLIDKIAGTLFECRESFGHSNTTISEVNQYARICPNASDEIDTLILKTQYETIDQNKDYVLKKLTLFHAENEFSLTIEKQIEQLALLMNLINMLIFAKKQKLESSENTMQLDDYWKELGADARTMNDLMHQLKKDEAKKEFVESTLLLLSMNQSLDQCPLLKGRGTFMQAQDYLVQFTKEILDSYHPKNRLCFIKACQILYKNHIPLSENSILLLKESPPLCKSIIPLKSEDIIPKKILSLFHKDDSLYLNPKSQSFFSQPNHSKSATPGYSQTSISP